MSNPDGCTTPVIESHRLPRFERVVVVILLMEALFVFYCWCVHVGDDLTWDEVMNRRSYARHPLTAVALYNEPNNHPLESLWKSLFLRLPGLRALEFARLPAFLLVIAFLWVCGRRALAELRRGQVAGGVLFAIGMLFAPTIYHHAMQLRGYFLSILLVVVFLLRAWGPTGDAAGHLAAQRVPRMLVVLGALLVFCVPSNAFFLPALWAGWALSHDGERPGAPIFSLLKRAGRNLLLSLGVGALLWLPIIVVQLLGWSSVHGSAGRSLPLDISRILVEMKNFAVIGGLFGMSVLATAGVLVVSVIAGVVHWRRSSRARGALALLIVLFFTLLAVSTKLEYPMRVRAPAAAAIVLAWTTLLAEAASHRTRTVGRAIAVSGLLIGVLGCFELATVTRFQREASTAARVLGAYTRPDRRQVVVIHDHVQRMVYPLREVFDSHRVCDGLNGFLEAVAIGRGESAPEKPPLQKKVEAFIEIDDDGAVVEPERCDVLVIIEDEMVPNPDIARHPEVKAITERLDRVRRLDYDAFLITVYERGP